MFVFLGFCPYQSYFAGSGNFDTLWSKHQTPIVCRFVVQSKNIWDGPKFKSYTRMLWMGSPINRIPHGVADIYIYVYVYIYTGWWFGTCFYFSIQLGISSSQLMNSYFQRGETTNQYIYIFIHDTISDHSAAKTLTCFLDVLILIPRKCLLYKLVSYQTKPIQSQYRPEDIHKNRRVQSSKEFYLRTLIPDFYHVKPC